MLNLDTHTWGNTIASRNESRQKRYNEESWLAGRHTPNTGICFKSHQLENIQQQKDDKRDQPRDDLDKYWRGTICQRSAQNTLTRSRCPGLSLPLNRVSKYVSEQSV